MSAPWSISNFVIMNVGSLVDNWKNGILNYLAVNFCKMTSYRVFSLTWPASMQIYWNKRKCLQKKRVQLPEDWFGTLTWPTFHCLGHQYGRRDVMWKHSIFPIPIRGNTVRWFPNNREKLWQWIKLRTKSQAWKKKKKTLENNMKRRRLQTHVLNLTIVNSTISSQVD